MPTLCKDCKKKRAESIVINSKYSKVINSCHKLISTAFSSNFRGMRSAHWRNPEHCNIWSQQVYTHIWQVGPLFKRNIFRLGSFYGKRGWGSHRRELINVEVLSGGIDGPTFRVPCATSNWYMLPVWTPVWICWCLHCFFGPCCSFLCCVGFALPALC